jgi:hypothetical protein
MNTDELQKTVAQLLISALENHQMAAYDMQQAAGYFLDAIVTVKTDQDVAQLLADMKTQWPLFEDVSRVYAYKANKDKEKEVIERLRTHISQFSVQT